MSEPKMVSEREAVKRERDAYILGVREGYAVMTRHEEGTYPDESHDRAKRLYPFSLERPRVVSEGQAMEWRLVNGFLQWRWTINDPRHEWANLDETQFTVTRARVEIWHTLFQQPTETVEAEP